MNLNRFAHSCLCALVFLISGCGDAGDEPSYGEWTVSDSLRLSQDLLVGEAENFYFGTVADLNVTSEGHMVVADRQAHNIKVLHPDGTLLDTLGGPGEGPGEFQQLTSVQIARGDSLYAYDVRRSRLTVFAPDSPYEMARTLTVHRDAGFPVKVWVLTDGFLAMYSSPMTDPEEGVSRPSSRTVRWVDGSGEPQDTLLTYPGPKMVTVKSDGGGFRVRTIPFSRTVKVEVGPDGTPYYGTTDSLHIQTRTPDGGTKGVASLSTEPVPLTEAARDSALSLLDGEMRSMVAPALPETKPLFTEFTVADDGRIWIKGSTVHSTSENAPWLVVNPDTKTIRPTRLPREVEITAVQNGTAYGITRTNAGAPAVVRYQIES
jgi:hypothetical protein